MMHEEALAAGAAFQQDGRYVTGDDADAWPIRLGAGEDVAPPVPHE